MATGKKGTEDGVSKSAHARRDTVSHVKAHVQWDGY